MLKLFSNNFVFSYKEKTQATPVLNEKFTHPSINESIYSMFISYNDTFLQAFNLLVHIYIIFASR